MSLHLASLQEVQRKELMAIVKHAYENVPLYHRKFDEAGIKPDGVKSVDDLPKIPMLTKSEIQSSPLSDVVAKGVEVNKCVTARTSGSTGLPLKIFEDKAVRDFRIAVMTRAYWEDGLRPWDKLAVIDDPRVLSKNKGLPEQLGISRRKYISVFDDVSSQLALLEAFKPDAIKAFPSSLAILAHVCTEKRSHIRPRLILTNSELLYKDDVKLIRSVFECQSVDDYGCYELGQLAWECPEHTGYHMNIDGTVIEFVNDGEQVAPGERGEVVCTSLINYTMPLVRYRLGDEGVYLSEGCSCGRSLPLMKILEGRKDDFLTALDGRIISPLIFFPYPFENLEGINQFRVIQERKDRLTIQIVGKENSPDNKALESARKEIERVFGDGMQVEFQFLEKIERDSGGKLRKIISRVPVNWSAAEGEAIRCNEESTRQ